MAIKKSENLETSGKIPVTRKKTLSAKAEKPVKKPVSATVKTPVSTAETLVSAGVEIPTTGTQEPVPLPAGDISAATIPPVFRSREFAMSVLGLGLAFGILHSYFFFGQKLGISYPIFMALTCLALWYFGKTQGKGMEKKEFFWFVPILYFSLMVAVRSAELLTFLNVVVSFFWLLVLVWMRTPVEGERIFRIHRTLSLPFAFMANWFAAFRSLRQSFGTKPEKDPTVRADKWAKIIKGCMLSIPLIWIYIVLFSSGDLVFRGALGDLANWLASWNFPELPDFSYGRTIFIVIWSVGFGGLFDAYISKMVFPYKNLPVPETPRNLGSWEANIPLAVSNFIFLSFALLQLRYVLGGYGAIGPSGFTYAEYAKNGYFELSVAAAISFVVIFLVGRHSVLREGQLDRLTKYLCLGLVAQVGFVIWCAFSRLSMYQEAYGLTLTRFYGYVFLFWMVGAFAFLSYKTWVDGTMKAFAVRMAKWMLAILIGLNLMNPSGFVARENIGRPNDPEVLSAYPNRGMGSVKVDYGYLSTLSVDAIPEIAPTMTKEQVIQAYGRFRFRPDMPWFSYWFGQQMAVWAMEARGRELGIPLGNAWANTIEDVYD